MKPKLGIGVGAGFGVSVEDAAPQIKAAGFDACFTGWSEDASIEAWANTIARAGLIYQSVHAPYNKMNTLWGEGEQGEFYTDQLIRCLNDCEHAGVPIMVVHPIIGMDKHSPNELGVKRFARLVDAAEKTHVKVAFENVEGLEYLRAVMDGLGSSDSVGFCFDTGHEMCYNFSEDVMALFGSKLVCTHFNDNMGMADKNTVTWLDDAHMLPFDGIADWAGIVRRIEKYNYNDIFTFELTRASKPGKHTHDAYADWSYAEFLAHAYKRAARVAALKSK